MLLGTTRVKSAHKYVGEIDSRCGLINEDLTNPIQTTSQLQQQQLKRQHLRLSFQENK